MAELPKLMGVARAIPAEPKVGILLVDDHPANLLSLRAILDDADRHLVEARSGEEALRLMEAQEFAVVLLDVFMPGLSGFETARRIRERDRGRHTPIIFLTANDVSRTELEEGYRFGAVDYLVKPLVPIILQAKVRGFVELYQEKRRARQEAEQLRLLVQGTTDHAIFLLDPEGHIVTWNVGAERLKGYRAEDIIGQHFSRFYPQEAKDRRWPQHELEVARAEGRFEDEGWRVRKDGSRFWANVVITALRDEAGNLRGFSKVTRDMTERRIAEENARHLVEEAAARRAAENHARVIQEQRERLYVTLTSIGDGVITIDAAGHIVFLNPVAEHLVGWTTTDAAGKPLTEVFRIVNEHTHRPVENPALQALREGKTQALANHTLLVARDGTERPIDDSAAPIRDTEGKVIGSVLVFRDISERKRAQRALQESEGRFRGLMEQAPFSVQVFAPDGHVVRVNQAWEDLWGIPAADITDYNILEDGQLAAKGVLAHVKQAFAGQTVTIPPFEYDPHALKPGCNRPQDARRWVSAVAYPLKDDKGQVREVVLVHEDLTARRRAEQEREMFAFLVQNSQDFIGLCDRDFLPFFINREGLRLVGLESVEQARDIPVQDFFFPEDRTFVTESFFPQVLRDGHGEVEIRFRHFKTGQAIWMAYSVLALRDAAGERIGLATISRDITAKRQTEEELRRSERLYRAIGESIDYGVWVCDPQGRNTYVSESFQRLVGLTQEECSAFGWAQVLHPEDVERALRDWQECVRTGQQWDREHRFRGVDGKYHHVLARGVPVKNERGEITAWAGINLDIGRLKQVEEELRAADRRKDEFLATLAHELRNPLAPIRNSLQILKMSQFDPADAQQTLDMMERQVHHLVRLVDDLLDVSRVMRGKIELRKEPVELSSVIARAVEIAKPLIEAHSHQLDLAIPSESLLLDADPVRLAQVVGNLLTNSAKYSEARGQIQLSARRDGDHAVLLVRDSGIGIASPLLPHVFELFVQADHTSTRAQGGLGIGLTLVKNLVEMHGGAVVARSPGLGRGSEFEVRLPLRKPVASAQPPEHGTARPGSSRASSHRLLVVDDNEDAAISLAMLLRLYGHDVRVAHDGATALELATSYRPLMVFLDIGMPGMDGFEVARRLRQTPGLEKTVLTALTGWGQKEDRRRTAEAGFDHHLVKPPELQAVESLLASLPEKA